MNNKNTQQKIKTYFDKFINITYKRLLDIYTTKYLIWKLIAIFSTLFVVLLSSFLTRDAILNRTSDVGSFMPGFIDIKVIGNTGVAFSIFSNGSASLVYFVQILPIIIAFGFLIFSKSLAYDIGLSMIFAGGLSNVIDRGLVDNYAHIKVVDTVDAVVDYFYFSFIKGNSAIFNLPDIFVICGVITISLTIVVNLVKEYLNEKKEKNNGVGK